jgi:hypothetical protein
MGVVLDVADHAAVELIVAEGLVALVHFIPTSIGRIQVGPAGVLNRLDLLLGGLGIGMDLVDEWLGECRRLRIYSFTRVPSH